MTVYTFVKNTRLHSLHYYSHTHQILAHWHTPIHCKNLQTKNPAETPTNPTCLQHIHTLHLQNTTYLQCPYKHALQLQPTLLYHHYNTTRPIICATQWPCPCTHAQWAGGWPGKWPLTSDRILCAATCIGDHIMFENLEPPEEGKSIEFPRKHAILADCTTIDCTILIAGVRYPRLKPCAQPHR